MADDVVNMFPPPGTFGAMTAEQLIAMTKNPPAPDKERGGPGADPLGSHLKASDPRVQAMISASASTQNVIGKKYYHRRRKEEVTLLASINSTYAEVRSDNGKIYKAKIEFLTRLS